jgi:hypothetical protein
LGFGPEPTSCSASASGNNSDARRTAPKPHGESEAGNSNHAANDNDWPAHADHDQSRGRRHTASSSPDANHQCPNFHGAGSSSRNPRKCAADAGQSGRRDVCGGQRNDYAAEPGPGYTRCDCESAQSEFAVRTARVRIARNGTGISGQRFRAIRRSGRQFRINRSSDSGFLPPGNRPERKRTADVM